MKASTNSLFNRRSERPRRSDLDLGHFRSGRWILLAQGIGLTVLGFAGLGKGLTQLWHGGGVAVLGFRLTPLHAWMLLGFGLLALLAPAHRRATIVVTGLSLVAAVLAFTIGVTATTDGPGGGTWGLDLRDAWLHGILIIGDLMLLIWLLMDELHDAAWMRKQRACGYD